MHYSPASVKHPVPENAADLWNDFYGNLDENLSPMAASLMLDSAFGAFYGFKKMEVTEDNPIPFICNDGSLHIHDIFEEKIRELIDLEAPKITGLSTEELLDLPVHVYDMYVRRCKEYSKSTSDTIDNILGNKKD